ncbi:MAG: tetratricopeptide repeat protein [Deltaproteobacteria bacterium]|nr:tetratricopeptide repeat protein [Deltaproteobacteria bacterium]
MGSTSMRATVTSLKFIMSHLMNRKKDRREGIILCLLLIALAIQSPALSQPRSPAPEDSLLFREGEILFSRGETEKALWRFKRLITEHPQSPLLNEARFRMAICYTQLKRHKDAIRTLNDLLSTFLAPPRMIQVFTFLGDNHLELKEWANALLWYGKGLLVSGQPHEELKKKVRAVVDTFDTEEELNQVESAHRGAYAGGYAKLKLAQKAKYLGYDLIARKMLNEMEKEYPGMDYVGQAKEVSESISIPKKSKYLVGIILPLSGIQKPFGEKALQGIRLGLKEKESQDKIPLISLVIRDSKGSASEAEKAVEELAKTEKVTAIIGPLLSSTVDRASKKAQQLKVPLLSLSQKEPTSGKGEFVFQNSLTPLDQVQGLVSFSVKELGLRTFAVFYPNSPYGFHFKNLFNQEVARMGGKVFGAVVYQEEQTDFRQEIKGFFKVETIQKQEETKRKEEEFKQGLSVDGLFIPDTHDRVGIILSQMAYFDVKGTTFLGTNAWNGPGLISVAGKAAEGAIFVDAFSKVPSIKNFVDEFQKEYQRQPETLDAICYDGARFLGEILQSKSPSSPSELKEELRKFSLFQGVSGLKGFGEDGKAIRTLSILRVKNGQIEHFSP